MDGSSISIPPTEDKGPWIRGRSYAPDAWEENSMRMAATWELKGPRLVSRWILHRLLAYPDSCLGQLGSQANRARGARCH
jgi:hypothetical protein